MTLFSSKFPSQARLEMLVKKLGLITLSSAPLVEIDPEMIAIFELWRKQAYGKLSSKELAVEMYQRLGLDVSQPHAPMKVLWEPLSDEVGDAIEHQGWTINTTMYLWNGQPWWLMQADRAKPFTSKHRGALDEVIVMLGGDPTRDLLLELTGADVFTIRYTWAHQGPLYETHLHPKTHAIRAVPEGTPLEEGFERIPRIDFDNLPGRRN